MTIVVCLKSVPLRVEVDALTGHVSTSDAEFGLSPADESALEWALRLGEAWSQPVDAVTLGPPRADAVLRTALACGATSARRVTSDGHVNSDEVARALTVGCRDADLVVCGDYSLDGGSGSVPAFLAARLGRPQALGLLLIETLAVGQLRLVRRLDGGRRERLTLSAPAVVSVEGGSASLRRAGLAATMAAARAFIVVDPWSSPVASTPMHAEPRPLRARPRLRPAPAGADALARVRALLDVGSSIGRSQPVTVTPAQAADRIVAALTAWGYLAE